MRAVRLNRLEFRMTNAGQSKSIKRYKSRATWIIEKWPQTKTWEGKKGFTINFQAENLPCERRLRVKMFFSSTWLSKMRRKCFPLRSSLQLRCLSETRRQLGRNCVFSFEFEFVAWSRETLNARHLQNNVQLSLIHQTDQSTCGYHLNCVRDDN